MEERKCQIGLKNADGKIVEILETRATDEAHARKIADEWGGKAGVTFETIIVRWF